MSEDNEIKSIELYSDELQEVLIDVPKGIIRWGTTVILIVIAILFAGSALFKYPDIINAKIVLTTQTPPVKLISRVSGKIEELLVTDNQIVKKGDVLALLETAADYENVIESEKIAEKLTVSLKNEDKTVLTESYQLGEIQSYFSSFIREYNDYKDFIQLNYFRKKIQALRAELEKFNNYYGKLEEQSRIQNRELELALKQFKRDSLLYSKGVISDMDYEKSESMLMNKTFTYKETETDLAGAKVEISRLNQQILETELQNDEEERRRQNLVFESFERLKAETEIWKQKYMLVSPVDGDVSFSKYWSENQQVSEGETVLTVIPKNAGKIIGKINLGVEGAGKVKHGQLVNIKFSNYPFIEYGLVKGKISLLSLVPDKDFYTAEVELINGLVTNYNIPIEFQQEMPGEAEIITKQLSLLRRIVNPFKSAVKKHVE